MEDLERGRRYRGLFGGYVGFVAAVTLLVGVLDVTHESAWSLGDWFINYSGGFVRRGLAGEVALLAGRAAHVPPAWIVLGMQLGCYAAMFWAVVWLVGRSVGEHYYGWSSLCIHVGHSPRNRVKKGSHFVAPPHEYSQNCN